MRVGNKNRHLNRAPEAYFRDSYDDVMYTGAVGRYSAFVHRLMERPYRDVASHTILELGAGKGQHRQYVTSHYDEYWEVDIDPQLLSAGDGTDPRVRRFAWNAESLDEVDDARVDRLVATCLLAHLTHPEDALREWRRVLKPGGHAAIYIPAEPGMLLRAGRAALVAPKSRKLGQDHHGVVYRDHRNHYPGMRRILVDTFRDDKVRRVRFPLPFVGWNFAVFDIFHIRKSDVP